MLFSLNNKSDKRLRRKGHKGNYMKNYYLQIVFLNENSYTINAKFNNIIFQFSCCSHFVLHFLIYFPVKTKKKMFRNYEEIAKIRS